MWAALFMNERRILLVIIVIKIWCSLLREFVNCVKCIRILSPQEVQQMSLDGDLGNNVLSNQACSSSDGGNAWRPRCDQNPINPSIAFYDQFEWPDHQQVRSHCWLAVSIFIPMLVIELAVTIINSEMDRRGVWLQKASSVQLSTKLWPGRVMPCRML